MNGNKEDQGASTNLLLAFLIFLSCIPQAGSLLLKVYGLMPLQSSFLFIALPGLLLIISLYIWSKSKGNSYISHALELGFAGGLAGTIAYDLGRLPFLLMGLRVFAPIDSYGVWLLNTHCSSNISDLAGWLYHFNNGISFGIMYALFMQGRSVFWAVLWACGLETIAFLSPFGRIYGFTGNYTALGIAYFGHILYGIPLGMMTRNAASTLKWMKSIPKGFYVFGFLVAVASILGPFTTDEFALSKKQDRAFQIEGERIQPEWLRIRTGQVALIKNKDKKNNTVLLKKLDLELEVPANETRKIEISSPGIYQIFVKTPERSHSSFLMIEPVEKAE